jgi:hypothetical protein
MSSPPLVLALGLGRRCKINALCGREEKEMRHGGNRRSREMRRRPRVRTERSGRQDVLPDFLLPFLFLLSQPPSFPRARSVCTSRMEGNMCSSRAISFRAEGGMCHAHAGAFARWSPLVSLRARRLLRTPRTPRPWTPNAKGGRLGRQGRCHMLA